MKIEFDVKCFVQKIKLALAIIPEKTLSPILQCVKIVATNDGVSLHATDGNVGIRIPVSCVDVLEDGIGTVSCKDILGLLNSARENRCILEIGRSGTLHLKSNTLNFDVFSDEMSDAPIVVSGTHACYEVSMRSMLNAVKRVLFAVGKPDFVKIPAIAGVLLSSFKDRFNIVGTDNFRLAWQEIAATPLELGNVKTTVPIEALKLIESISKDKTISLDSMVQMTFMDKSVIFQFLNGIAIVSNVVEHVYPKWKSVIYNTVSMHCVEIPSSDLYERLKSLSQVMGNRDSQIDMVFSKNKLKITCRKKDGKSTNVTMAIKSNLKAEMVLDIKHLLDYLKVLNTDAILYWYIPEGKKLSKGRIKPILLRAPCVEFDGYTYIIQPAMLDSPAVT